MSGWLLVAPVTLLAPSNPCVAPAAGGDEDNHKEQPESPGERRPGGKKHMRWGENQPEEQGPWARSATAANVINSRPGCEAGATLSKHGRGRWILSQKQ